MQRSIFLLIGLLCTLSACNNQHFISDSQQRKEVTDDLNSRKATLNNASLFSILDSAGISVKEREALEFLYAYMPLGDITDYPGSYHLANVQAAFKAKEEMPWGKAIPEREFNHFVMPERINNENLDDFRTSYYEELKARVKDLSLYDAVLEVNHWCHEKANYKGSDSRTSSPMATIKTSWGRCGEESTLLVAALRIVCIPARQVYTPRWAHCDDNHAWVEAYVDGQWHFLGACEPEPVLDLGWFNAPASRCLLLHTRVFGHYHGPEEVIEQTQNHTEINVVSNYANTAKAFVKVTDSKGEPVPNATVDFKIYNYSEFCTVASKTCDSEGITWLTAGLGDMMAYASRDGKFGFGMIRFGQTDTLDLVLDKDTTFKQQMIFDIVPPAENVKLPEVSETMRAENDRRIADEDTIRNAYIAKCQQEQQSDNDTLQAILAKSWGNYQTIKDFMNYADGNNLYAKAIALLNVISDKDLRDVSLDVLKDNLDNCPVIDNELYNEYILCPRVSNEMLCPYRKVLMHAFDDSLIAQFKANPQLLADWINDNIAIHDEMNVRSIPMFPTGVLKAKAADSHSRDIFFVAAARSIGIAAQKDPVTGNILYHDGQQWQKAHFGETVSAQGEKGFLHIIYTPIASVPDPRYYTNFSIKKFNGTTFDLLAYDDKDPGMDVGMTLSQFSKDIPLDEGYYLLSSGTRQDDGSVLNSSVFFSIKAGQTTPVNMILREPETTASANGNINMKMQFQGLADNNVSDLSQIVKGHDRFILALLDQGSEPTTHAMQDIITAKKSFDEIAAPILFIFGDKATYDRFMLKRFNSLPDGIVYGIGKGNMTAEVADSLKLANTMLPIFVVADKDGKVAFVKQGYSIGLADQMLKYCGK